MTTHTPGPWVVCNSTDVFTPLGAPRADGRHAEPNDGWHIADCDMGLTQCDGERLPLIYGEKEANAKLIAAAPELLHTLVMIRDADEDCRRDGRPTIPATARAVIDSAIAKATGAKP